jgi:hypothetical protein
MQKQSNSDPIDLVVSPSLPFRLLLDAEASPEGASLCSPEGGVIACRMAVKKRKIDENRDD